VQAVWSLIERHLEQAKMVQLDRIRRRPKGVDPWTVAVRLGTAGRGLLKALTTSSSR
jgi:hypothetical protein